MSRYRRVNIDGKSLYKTETRVMAAALLPGTFVQIDGAGKWAAAPSGALGRLYVLGAAEHQGLGIRDAVPVNDSGIGGYVEEGREFAILVPAGAYSKDQPIAVGASGRGAASGTNVVGYCQDDAVLDAEDFIRVRMRTVLVAPAPTGVTVTPETASIEVGETVNLSAVVAPSGASQGVTWSSSDDTKATVSAGGAVTGVAAGTATITATSTADNTKTDTAAITVTAA